MTPAVHRSRGSPTRHSPTNEEKNDGTSPSPVVNNKHLILEITKVLVLVAVYFPLSIGLTFYNKWFVKDFKFPLFATLFHYLIKFTLSASFRMIYKLWKRKGRIWLTCKENACRVGPAGLTSAVDIGLSNWSLEFITVSLYTMAKSSCIVFILLFGLIFGLEKFRLILIVIVASIALGLFMFTYESTQFNLLGFILVELAAMCCGLRWTLSQLVLQKDSLGLHNPIDMMFFIQPWMILGAVPMVAAFEGSSLVSILLHANHKDHPLRRFGLIFSGGMIAFCLEFSEFLLLRHTSSLTLSICGILKEILTLYLAHHYNNDRFSTINMAGFVICVSGIALHVIMKAHHERSVSSDKDESLELAKLLLDDEEEDQSVSENEQT